MLKSDAYVLTLDIVNDRSQLTVEARASFPEGSFLLEPHHAWLWTDAVEGDHGAGVHPGVAVMIALAGAGASISDIMAHLATEAEHVLFGEITLAFDRSLRVGTQYRIATAIVSIERKSGRRFAAFDRVAVDYRLSDGDKPVATIGQIWIVDRS